MAARKSLLCSAALLLGCFAIVNFQPAEAQCGGFCASCTNIAIIPNSRAILQANCKTDSSGSVYASLAEIGLDSFIGNSNGILVDGADFFESCQDLGTVPLPTGEVLLKANCKDDSGTLQLALFHMNNNIVNVNGALNWNYC